MAHAGRHARAAWSSAAAALQQRFVEHRGRDLAALTAALQQEDFETIARLGHSMRGNGVSYGHVDVSAIGERLEAAANDKNVGLVAEELGALGAWIARVRGETADGKATVVRGEASMSNARPEPVNVLVVDDVPANLVALRAVLAPLGVRTVEARSGPEAVQLASHESFAVVLLDVHMPGMDGFQVAQRLRETPTGAELPIIFLTAADGDEEYVHRGYALGAADYITKPFASEVLLARVKAFVDLFKQRERLRIEQVDQRTRERDEALERLAALLESERAARREAELANRAKDEFLGTVSHELRTPLGGILGWAMIARRWTLPPEVDRVLATIQRHGRTQLRIVEDMLDVGRIVGGKLILEPIETLVGDAIDGAVLAIKPDADAKRVILDVAVGDVGSIVADPERLQQIVSNLLSNAVKFTPSGGHVRVRATREKSTVRVVVSDDGPGISADFLPHLFETFRQADGAPSRRHRGLGLGLAIARQLVEAHHGTIAAASEGTGKGATFTVEIPVRAMPATSPFDRPTGRRAALLAGLRLDGVRLLVVDDDDDARDLLVQILSDRGAKVSTASCAAEAVRLVEQAPPDILLSDVGMPDVSGYDLIQQIRAMPVDRGGRIPAIALTAYARHEDAKRALAAGFQAHVTKPIEPDRLTATIAELARVSI
jgi:signal transduction histidine kinase